MTAFEHSLSLWTSTSYSSPLNCTLILNLVSLKKLVHRSRHPRDPAPSFSPSSTTSPLTRKRKVSQTAEEANQPVKTNKLSTLPSKYTPKASSRAALNTPPLTTMDSDDEFMSGLSSQDEDDFGGAQESDDGSLGDGTCTLHGGMFIKLTL